MKQITQLIEVMRSLAAVVTVLWVRPLGIDTTVGLHAKVPLIAFLGLMHLRSRCCSFVLVELGASMMVASTKVPCHHDACFGQPAIDGLEQLTAS